MELLITLLYLVGLSTIIWWLVAPRFVLLPRWLLVVLFLVKAGAGIYYGYWHEQRYGSCDTFIMFETGNYIYDKLDSDPAEYLLLTFYPNNTEPPARIDNESPGINFWTNTASYTVVRFNALARLVSFGYYNVHAILLSFFSFLALLYLFRFLAGLWPTRKWIFMGILFLVPSITFYGSGVHKEGFAITAIALVVPLFYQLMDGKRWAAVPLLLSLFLLYLVKDFYLASIVPCLLALMVTFKHQRWVPAAFITIFVSFWLSLFLGSALIPGLDVAEQIAAKQDEFRILVGNTNVFLPEVNASIWGIIQLAPTALEHTLLRPWPTEADSVFLLFYMLENAAMLTFVIICIIYSKRSQMQQPLFWFLVLFALAALIIIGVIVPNIGAISRYRVPAMLFWLLGFALLLDPGKLPFWKRKV